MNRYEITVTFKLTAKDDEAFAAIAHQATQEAIQVSGGETVESPFAANVQQAADFAAQEPHMAASMVAMAVLMAGARSMPSSIEISDPRISNEPF